METKPQMTEHELETRRQVLKTQALVFIETEKLLKRITERYDPFIAETVLLREKIEKLENENIQLKLHIQKLEENYEHGRS